MDPSQIATDTSYFIFMIFVALASVFLNGSFVLSELSIVKIRRSRPEEMVKERKPSAKKALDVTSKLDTYLSVCQLGITLSSLAFDWIGEPAIAKVLEAPLLKLGLNVVLIHTIVFVTVFSIIILLHVALGELVPESIAIAIVSKAVLWVARPLYWFWILFLPYIKIFDILAALTLKIFGIKPVKEHELTYSGEEIKVIVSESQKGGASDEFETEIIRNAVDLSDTMAKEVMTPRKDMICLNRRKSYSENIQIICEYRHTCFPYIDGSKDMILGMVHIRDIVQNELNTKSENLENLVRPLILMSENLSILKVSVIMNKERLHTVSVVDEYGGTVGLSTMEDIMEEIIGETKSEHGEDNYKKLADNIYEFQGRRDIEKVEELLLITYDEDSGQVTTGGYVFNLSGRLPVAGDRIEDELCYYEVRKMDGNSTERVKVVKKTEIEESEDQTHSKFFISD